VIAHQAPVVSKQLPRVNTEEPTDRFDLSSPVKLHTIQVFGATPYMVIRIDE